MTDSNAYIAPLSPRTLRRAEVYALAMLYWPVDQIDNAVAIAECESGFRTAAWNASGEDSRGLWQINVAAGAHPELAVYNLFDPQINAFFAHRIWLASGWNAWHNCATHLGLV